MATSTSSDIGSSEYSHRRKALFELIKKLRDLGAEADIGLPRIAVIGGQSAGKSSLVEAVTGIKVPRDSGTCTRCPMECSIRGGASSWSCQISIKRVHRNNGSRGAVTRFGPVITDKDDVEANIRRAQAAILSPHRSLETFVDKSREELKDILEQDEQALLFSEDVVVVDIEDPDGTDLFFVDLPGLIQNADTSDIETVKTLVEQYMADEKTLLLVTIPASEDLENVQAIKLAREADPEGTRTIGVVTKPDTLTPGATSAREKWRKIIQGFDSKHDLRHGYYCVRLPEDEERSNTRVEMERIANEFLRTTQPWASLHGTDRLGVRALVSYISALLMGIIEKSLLEILKNLQTRIAACENEMSKLPAPITVDPATEILKRVTAFCQDFQAIMTGRSEKKTFVHRNRAIYRSFAIAIRRTAPNFQPYDNLEHWRLRNEPEYLNDEVRELEYLVMEPIGLLGVRRVIKESISWELPRNTPYDAKAVLIKKFLELWPKPTKHCFDKICEIVMEAVNDQIAEHFKRFRRLESHVGSLIRTHTIHTFEVCDTAVEELLQSESLPFFTHNDHYLDSAYYKWLNIYKCARRNPNNTYFTLPNTSAEEKVVMEKDYEVSVKEVPLTPPHFARTRTSTEKTLDLLSQIGYVGLTEGDLVRLHPPDAFDEELCVMADVRAYFQVAYKRVIDNVPQTIHHALCHKLAESMQAYLLGQLQLSAPDASERFKDLLAEDPQYEIKREELREQITRLKDIKANLEEV